MTDTTEKTGSGKRGTLSISTAGRLGPRRAAEGRQARQNFSHGRTNTVAVEVKPARRRAKPKPAEDPAVAAPSAAPEAAPGDGKTPETGTRSAEAALRNLTDRERAARIRALEGAHQTEQAIAESQATREALETRRREEERLRRELEEQRRTEEAERRREEEEARRRQEAETARKAAEQAKRLEGRVPAGDSAAAKPAPGRAREDARQRPDRRQPSGRPTGGRRRDRKITISKVDRILNEDERQRSLASQRRRRERERQAEQKKETAKVFREVTVPETITVQELANRMTERAGDVTKALMNNGIMATITQTIDADTAQLIVEEFGHTAKRVAASDVEIGIQGAADEEAALEPRPPVVTVMGHVDHGKTSLLDALRKTDVAGGEAGGITQHIGAYQVALGDGHRITFVDTPGHEAFTEMRARGANITDIVIVVVAADDGVMPQTAEAINHARAAGVQIVVAINKIDRPEADPGRVRNELLSHDVVVESLGGDVQDVEISATAGTNLDKLVEAVALLAETLELRANPRRAADGVIVEAGLDSGRGAVATALVKRGTLQVGDIVVGGCEWGKVRALLDDAGRRIGGAGPSTPVEILGWNGAPDVGDPLVVVESEQRAREITEFRRESRRGARIQAGVRGPVDEILMQIQKGELKKVPIVVKGDAQGSIEAITQSLQKLGNDEVSVDVVHAGVGAIVESDVTLADASNALLAGFNVRANAKARTMAQREGIEIRYYSVIYDLIDYMKQVLGGMLAPERRETFLGNAEVREIFNISRVGRVAGCGVTEGVVRRGARVRLLRDSTVIHEGRLSTLKRFKDEVQEVAQGFECGMAFENYQDLRQGDVIECFDVEEIVRTL